MTKENDKNPILNKVARTSLLYDLYGGLLTEKKRRVMELYHEEDMSLSEIAEEFGISRAAVHDSLRSAEKNLEEYEEKLHLLSSYEERRRAVKKLKEIIKDIPAFSEKGNKHSEGIARLLDEIEK